ncbi:MAG: hypothetical protein ACHQ53_16505 [Polyangiales bacterium]
MAAPLKGQVQGKTVILDELVPPLEGKRVFVVLEPVDEPALDAKLNLDAWTAWVASDRQGPIADDDEPAFP